MSEEQPQVPQTEMEKEVNKEISFKKLKDALIGPTEDTGFNLPLFLGTMKEEHAVIFKTAATYLSMVRATNKGTNQREINVYKTEYEELRNQHFPDMADDELQPMLQNYFRFFWNGLDRALIRDETIGIVQESNTGNQFPGKDELIGLVNALKPSVNDKMGVRERMRRNFQRAYDQSDTFNVILYNSLIFMKISVPTPMDMVRLINDITVKLRQYGERYNISSLHLERAGISELLVNFMLDRCKYHSVKDTTDPYELKNIMLSNDINQIAQTLLCITSPKGVPYRLHCLANKCKHTEVVMIDPTAMLLEVGETMPEARWKLLLEVVNEGRRLSREEIAANPPVYLDANGEPMNVYVELKKGLGRLNIGVPTMSEFFSAFRYMAERINPELRQLAVDFPNPEIYNQKRKEVLAALRGSEYLQWFRSQEIYPASGEEGENIIITREEDSKEFDEGLMDIFNLDQDVYLDAIQQVITNAPRMTYTFVGIRDDVCPKCKEANQGSDRIVGFTPIDPVLNFFDHTRMTISSVTMMESIQEENLS